MGPTAAELIDIRARLALADPVLARVEAEAPVFEWRNRPGGYAGLLKIITAQQVSTASADAIWNRFEGALGEVTPETVLAAGDEAIRALGFSKPKARYALEIARAGVDFDALERMDDAEVMDRLTAIVGVGRWTAEIYLMFCLGRLDHFPAGDVALQEAIRWADGVEVRPDDKQARARAEVWAPWRGVAAHLLWAWYGAIRRGELPRPPTVAFVS